MPQGTRTKTAPPRADQSLFPVLLVLAVIGALVVGLGSWAFWTNDLRWRLAPPLISDFHFAERGANGAIIRFSEDYEGLTSGEVQNRIGKQGFTCSATSSAVECQRIESRSEACVEEWLLHIILGNDNRVVGGRGEINRQCP